MKLWLVRHARPLIEPAQCYGATDVPADPSATLDCAQSLAAILPAGLQLAYSPLQRCEHLAKVLQGLRTDLIMNSDDRLQEINFGSWEGVAWSDIPEKEFEPWLADFANYRFGGVESTQDLMNRVDAALCSVKKCADEAVWITHAGVIRAVTLLAQGVLRIDRAEQWPKQVTGFGQWLECEI